MDERLVVPVEHSMVHSTVREFTAGVFSEHRALLHVGMVLELEDSELGCIPVRVLHVDDSTGRVTFLRVPSPESCPGATQDRSGIQAVTQFVERFQADQADTGDYRPESYFFSAPRESLNDLVRQEIAEKRERELDNLSHEARFGKNIPTTRPTILRRLLAWCASSLAP